MPDSLKNKSSNVVFTCYALSHRSLKTYIALDDLIFYDSSELGSEVGSELGSEVGSELGSEVGNELGSNSLGTNFWNSSSNQSGFSDSHLAQFSS